MIKRAKQQGNNLTNLTDGGGHTSNSFKIKLFQYNENGVLLVIKIMLKYLRKNII